MSRQQRRAAAKHHKNDVTSDGACMKFVIENGEPVLYMILNGVKIAKRYSGQSWINLEPGYSVRGAEPGGDYNTVTVEYTDAAHH